MPLIKKPGITPQPEGPGPVTDEDLRLLADGSSEERRQAARNIGKLPEAAQSLGKALETEHDERVREAIFTALVSLNSPAAVEMILPHLRSDDAQIRTGALDALRIMPATVPYVAALLRDADSDVRILACEIARDLPSPHMAQALAGVLEADQVPNVCAAAVDALAEIGGPAELPVLRNCLDRFPSEPFLAFAIKVALARLVPAH